MFKLITGTLTLAICVNCIFSLLPYSMETAIAWAVFAFIGVIYTGYLVSKAMADLSKWGR